MPQVMVAQSDLAFRAKRRAQFHWARAKRERERGERLGSFWGQPALENSRNAEACAMALEKLAKRFA